MDAAAPKRRWFQFSLRIRFMLLLLIAEALLLVCEHFQWFGRWEDKGHGERELLTLLVGAALAIIAGFPAIFHIVRPRWRFQFSLRALMLFVTACAILFSWFGWKLQYVRHQQAAVEAANSSGGNVEYEYMVDEQGRTIPWAEPSGPESLRYLLGDDFFNNVRTINALGVTITDADMENIEWLKETKELSLIQTAVTDDGLEHLEGLHKLQLLTLWGTKITDAGLKHLEGLSELRRLNLYGTKVSDAGLAHLKGLSHLQWLDLTETQVTGPGLEHLKGLSELRGLGQGGYQLTDTLLKYLKALPQIRDINVDDDGTHPATIASMEKLRLAMPNCTVHSGHLHW